MHWNHPQTIPSPGWSVQKPSSMKLVPKPLGTADLEKRQNIRSQIIPKFKTISAIELVFHLEDLQFSCMTRKNGLFH